MAKQAPNVAYWVKLHLPDGMEIRRRPIDAVELLTGGEVRIKRSEFAKLKRSVESFGGKLRKKQIVEDGDPIEALPGAVSLLVDPGPDVPDVAEGNGDDEGEDGEAVAQGPSPAPQKQAGRVPFKGRVGNVGSVSPFPAGEGPPPASAALGDDPTARKIGIEKSA
jgi:hypothetical protein